MKLFVVICAALAILIMMIQIFMIRQDYLNEYWREYFACPSCGWRGWRRLILADFDPRIFVVMTAAAAMVLIVPVVLAKRWRSYRPEILATAVCVISVIDLFSISNAQWPYPPYAKRVTNQTFNTLVNGSFAVRRKFTESLADPTMHVSSVGLVAGWGFVRHENFFLQYFNADGSARPDVSPERIVAATRFFGADRDAKRLFLTTRIDYANPVDFIADVDATAASEKVGVAVEFFDGDTLRLDVHSPGGGWLSYVDNWDPNWTAKVDGRDVGIERLFGSYKSIRVPIGRSKVVLSYRPGFSRGR